MNIIETVLNLKDLISNLNKPKEENKDLKHKLKHKRDKQAFST